MHGRSNESISQLEKKYTNYFDNWLLITFVFFLLFVCFFNLLHLLYIIFYHCNNAMSYTLQYLTIQYNSWSCFCDCKLKPCRWWALPVWSLIAPTTGWCCVCCGAPLLSPSCCPCSSGRVTAIGPTSVWCGRSALPSCPTTTWMRVSHCQAPPSCPASFFLPLHLMMWVIHMS